MFLYKLMKQRENSYSLCFLKPIIVILTKAFLNDFKSVISQITSWWTSTI